MLLKDKQYNSRQLKLLDIWREYERAARELSQPITRIIFINNSPKNAASNDKRNLAGLPARCINKLNEFEEVQEMTVENFLYLMVKMGIEIEMEDSK